MALEKPKFGVVGYTFRDFDKSIDDVARFYGISQDEFMGANAVDATRVGWQAFRDGVRDGDSLALPIPEEELGLYWEKLNVGGRYTNLQAVCDLANTNPLRQNEQKLTPSVLLRYALNAELRVRLLAPVGRFTVDRPHAQAHRGKPATVERTDQEFGETRLPDKAAVFIPYARLPASQVVHVTPLRLDPMALDPAVSLRDRSTARAVPRWVKELYFDHIVPLLSDARALASANGTCHQCQHDSANEVAELRALTRFVDLMSAGRSSVPERLKHLRDSLERLLWGAESEMLNNPARVLFPREDDARLKCGARVADKIHDPGFSRADLVGPLVKENPFVVVGFDPKAMASTPKAPRRMRLGDLTAYVLLFSHQELSLAHADAAERGRRDLEAAVRLMGTAKSTASLPGSTITQSILSVVGVGDSMASVTFGNLPGPRSLSVALLTVRAAYALERAATLSPIERGFLFSAMTKAAGWSPKLSERYKLLLDPDPISTSGGVDAVREVNPSGSLSKEIAADLTSRVQCSFRWNAGVMFVNVIGIVLTLAQSDEIQVRYYADFTGSTIGSALAALQIVKKADIIAKIAARSTDLAKGASNVLTGLGVVATVATIVSGACTISEGLQKGNTGFVVAGVGQVAGGTSILFGMAFSVPGFQVVGGLLLIGAAVIKALSGDHPNKQLIIDSLNRLQHHAALFGLKNSWEWAMNCAVNCSDYRGILDTTENRDALAEIGFKGSRVLDRVLESLPEPTEPIPDYGTY